MQMLEHLLYHLIIIYTIMQAKTTFKMVDSSKTGTIAFMKAVFQCNAQITAAKFNFQDNQIFCGTNDGRICIFNLNSSSKVADFEISDRPSPITNMKVNLSTSSSSKVSSLLASTASGQLIEMQIIGRNWKKSWQLKEQDNYFQALCYSNKFEYFAASGQDCIIKIFDNQKKSIINNLKGSHWHKTGHNNRVFCVKYHPTNQNLIASGGWDQNIRIWDIRIGESVKGIVGPKICGDGIDIHQDILLSGSTRTTQQLQLWDLGTQKLIDNIPWGPKGQDRDSVYSCSFEKTSSTKNSIIASGSSSVKMFTIDPSTKTYSRTVQVQQIRSSVYVSDSGNSNPKFLFGTCQGQCPVFNISRLIQA